MKFHLGERIRFLDEVGEGIITHIPSEGAISVLSDDGFELTFPANKLVKIYSAENEKMTSNIESEHITTNVINADKPADINLKEEEIQNENTFKMNEINFIIGEEVSLLNEVGQGFVKKISAKGLITVELSNGFELVYLPRQLVKVAPPQETKSKTQVQIPQKETKAPQEKKTTPIFTAEDIAKLNPEKMAAKVREKERIYSTTISKQHTKYSGILEKEVDLHIEELIENTRGMSNAEMISLQLRTCQRELEEAISKHFRSIVFIHGVGNGRLKTEIHKLLKNYNKVTFHDASYTKYGFGATEVLIK